MASEEQIKKKKKKGFFFNPANVGYLPKGMLKAGALVRRTTTTLGDSSPEAVSLQASLLCQFKKEGSRALALRLVFTLFIKVLS